MLKSRLPFGEISSEVETAITSKIYEYAVTGRNVIFGLPDGTAKKIVQQLFNFYVYNPVNVQEISNLLLQLKAKVIDEEEVSKNRKFVKRILLRSRSKKIT